MPANAPKSRTRKAARASQLEGVVAQALGRLPAKLQLRLAGEVPLVIDGQTLDPTLQLLRALQRKRGAPGLCQPDPVTARVRFQQEIRGLTGPKTVVRAIADFTIDGEGGPLPVRHYSPPATTGPTPPLLVFLHGGGFVIGDIDTHDEPCRLLCHHARMHVLSVDYRLAPEHPFPAAVRDAVSALRWARAHAESLGADPARVAVGGDSAGGNLATLATILETRAGRPPIAQLLLYPPTDGITARRSRALFAEGFFLTMLDCTDFAYHYVDGANAAGDDPLVSPLYTRDLRALPPALVVTAGFDLLRDEGEAYAEALRSAGNVVRARRFPSLTHGFISLTSVAPAARQAVIEIAGDWRAMIDGGERMSAEGMTG